MNPLVKVSAAPGSPQKQLVDPSFLQGFDLVLAVGQPLMLTQHADELCAARGVKFMAAAVRGASSFYFNDLGSHVFKAVVRLVGYAGRSSRASVQMRGAPTP